jgi:hypothetical protein
MPEGFRQVTFLQPNRDGINFMVKEQFSFLENDIDLLMTESLF